MTEQGSASLRLLTLNVCGLPAALARRLAPFPVRAAELGRRLEASDVDVASFQEVWSRSALAALRAALPSFVHVAWRRGAAGQPAGGLATFSRWPVTAVRYRSFAGTRPSTGGLRFRVARAVNATLQGVLTLELSGLDIALANTHLSANRDGDWSAGNRHHDLQRAQLDRLHRILKASGTGNSRLAVVAGDFNVAADGPLYRTVVGGGIWRDPFAAPDPATFHRAFLPAGAVGHRIDYLLLRGAGLLDGMEAAVWFADPVALAGGPPGYLTDHCGLSVRIGRPDPVG